MSIVDILRPLVEDIFKFCKVLRFEPTWQQRLLLAAVQRGEPRITCRSGQGPGKTAASVIVGLWRAIRAVDSLTVVTAPTMRQCTEVWLSEATQILSRASLGVQKIFDVQGKKIVIAGRKSWSVLTVTATKAENAQGFHRHGAQSLTIIGEEASGISREIMEQYLGTVTNPDNLLLLIGNPNLRDCYFYDTHHGPHAYQWSRLVFNSEESPLVDKANLIRLEEQFTKDSDVYRIRVLGEFPTGDPTCVLSDDDILPMMEDSAFDAAVRYQQAGRAFGLDFARYGGDENVVTHRSGLAQRGLAFRPRVEPRWAVKKAFALQRAEGWGNHECTYVADAGGMGQGLMHLFYDAHKQLHEFHTQGVSGEPRAFANKMTEGYFHLRNLARRLYKKGHSYHKAPLPYLLRDPILLRQLTTRQYYTDTKNRLILEKKKDYMHRGHTSPDRADALVMCYYPHLEASARIGRR